MTVNYRRPGTSHVRPTPPLMEGETGYVPPRRAGHDHPDLQDHHPDLQDRRHDERDHQPNGETVAADPADRPRDPDPERPSWLGGRHRTLADVSDQPPGDLLLGMLEPAGETLAYAAPGVGKGTTGAWMAVELQRLGMRPVIYDAERRPQEWARRVSGFGGDRSRIAYFDPFEDLPPQLAGRPIWDTAATLRDMFREAGADILILDSILPAVGVGEDRLRSDAQVPFLFVGALRRLGIPSVSFGHPPKGQPEGEPFGSFAWLAAMRLTWLGTRAEGEGHRVRWRPRKRNERGHIPGVLLSIEYGEDGRPSSILREDDEENARDWLLGALVHGPMSVAELTEEMLAEMDDPATGEADRIRDRLGRQLNRMKRAGWVERIGPPGGRGVRWQLAERKVR